MPIKVFKPSFLNARASIKIQSDFPVAMMD